MNPRHVSPEIATRIEHAWDTILSSLREHKIYDQISLGARIAQTMIRDLAIKNTDDATSMRRTKKEITAYQETCTNYFDAQFKEFVNDLNRHFHNNATPNLLKTQAYPPINKPDVKDPLNYAMVIVKQNEQYYADAWAVIRLTREILNCPNIKNEDPVHPLYNMFNALEETCMTLRNKATRQWLELVIVKSDPMELQAIREQIVKDKMSTELSVEAYVKSSTHWVGTFNEAKLLCSNIKEVMEQPLVVKDASIDLGLGM